MVFDFKEAEKNTQRCPKCGWVSVTKVTDENPYLGLMFQPTGDYFICRNAKCDVDRIYGDNAILLRGGNNGQVLL